MYRILKSLSYEGHEHGFKELFCKVVTMKKMRASNFKVKELFKAIGIAVGFASTGYGNGTSKLK